MTTFENTLRLSADDPERTMLARVERWQANQHAAESDLLAVEEPLELRIGGRSLATIMRTPGHDSDLVRGFLLTEGVVNEPSDVVGIAPAMDELGLPQPNELDIILRDRLHPDESRGDFERHFSVNSSCGLCGKTTIGDIFARAAPLSPDKVKVLAQTIYRMPDVLRQAQEVFARTGGLHAAGLFTTAGELVVLREDIGRHNTVDKIIGDMAAQGRYPLADYVLLVSGRASFEIIQKALVARIPIVAAVSAPSTLAVELAEAANISLIAFLRGDRMNVYCAAHRVVSDHAAVTIA